MKLYYVLPLFLITSCGTTSLPVDEDPSSNNNIDPVLMPFVEKFTNTLHVPAYNLSVQFSSDTTLSDGGNYIAECFMGSSLSILVFTQAWGALDDTTKEIVIFHELGHCLLNRVHRFDYIDFYCPASIMYPTPITTQCYSRFQPTYYNELKTQVSDPSLSAGLSNLPEFTVTNDN